MKKYVFWIFPIILTACGGEPTEEPSSNESEENSDSLQNPNLIEYKSSIRPDTSHFDLTRTYTDTLEYLTFEDNYDYLYAIFKGKSDGDRNIRLVCDLPIDSIARGSILSINWKVDTCYEPGEQEYMYYSQRLVNFKILKNGDDRADFLRGFINAYSSLGNGDIEKFIHPDIGVYRTYNPGAACWAELTEDITGRAIPPDIPIIEGFPEGGMCEGFPGIENGFYYTWLPEYELPQFSMINEKEEEVFQTPISDLNYTNGYFMRVIYIQDEYQVLEYFFIKPSDQWYLWIINACDCSA